MRPRLLPHALLTMPMALLATSAMAHEGHGLSGPHWHATDVLGFVAVAAVVAAFVWFGRK